MNNKSYEDNKIKINYSNDKKDESFLDKEEFEIPVRKKFIRLSKK